MYNDVLLNQDDSSISKKTTSVDLDTLFENLSNDVESVNNFISNLNKQKKANTEVRKR